MSLSQYRAITLLVHAGAGSGMGGKYASQIFEGVQSLFPCAKVEIVETQNKKHIAHLGHSSRADLILCVTGDGSVHDLAQTLVKRPSGSRPIVGVIPVGSGNDYARTLGMPLDPLKALKVLPDCVSIKADVGKVNTVYFLQTLSFGVDAAVALNTEKLRKSTQTRGLRLYARAAINAILHEFNAHVVQVHMGENAFSVNTLILAVQNGPTYGSGFKVAPRASITDGMLDVYLASDITRPLALYYLSQMKNGRHEGLKGFNSYKTSQLALTFDEQLPIQCDGERLLGLQFNIELVPAALDVLVFPAAAACEQIS